MADLILSQAEAETLLSAPKVCEDASTIVYPKPGGTLCRVLLSGEERFHLDVTRSSVRLTKASKNLRARGNVVLARLCLDGAPHQNPDGEKITGPHLHLYREGFGDAWAIPAPVDRFGNFGDLAGCLRDFMRFCNVDPIPNIHLNLF